MAKASLKGSIQALVPVAATLAVVALIVLGTKAIVSLLKEDITTIKTNKKPLTFVIDVISTRGSRSSYTVTVKNEQEAWGMLVKAQQAKVFTPLLYAKVAAAEYWLFKFVHRRFLLEDSEPFFGSTKYDVFKWAMRQLSAPPRGILSYKMLSPQS